MHHPQANVAQAAAQQQHHPVHHHHHHHAAAVAAAQAAAAAAAAAQQHNQPPPPPQQLPQHPPQHQQQHHPHTSQAQQYLSHSHPSHSHQSHSHPPTLPAGSHQIVTTTQDGTVTHFVNTAQQQQQQQQAQASPQPGAYPYHQPRSVPSGAPGPPPPPIGTPAGASPFVPHDDSRGRFSHPAFHAHPQTRLYHNMSQYATNPVGALQERFQSRGIVPAYRVVQAEGASHCPTFSFQVIVQDMVATGSGNSKKQAKHNAARVMLDQLDGRLPVQDGITPLPPVGTVPAIGTSVQLDCKVDESSLTGGSSPAPTTSAVSPASSAVSGVKVGNTIGQLQELCVHEGYPMPVYDLGSVDGQPHQRNFQMSVRVGSMGCRGEGTSKKDAKRDAALKMIARIQEEKAAGRTGNKETTKDKDNASIVSKDSGHASSSSGDELHLPSAEDEELAAKLSGMKIESLNQKHLAKIQSFYTQLNESRSRQLLLLHREPLNSRRKGDYVRMLQDLAGEQKFEVTFVENEERTDDEEVQSLVQLSSLPVAVCYGTGSDTTAANQDAARSALNYLKMMTKEFMTKGSSGGASSISSNTAAGGSGRIPANNGGKSLKGAATNGIKATNGNK